MLIEILTENGSLVSFDTRDRFVIDDTAKGVVLLMPPVQLLLCRGESMAQIRARKRLISRAIFDAFKSNEPTSVLLFDINELVGNQ